MMDRWEYRMRLAPVCRDCRRMILLKQAEDE